MSNYDTIEVRQEICSDWYINESVLEGCKILYSNYTYEDYSGSGYVLFVRDGKLYEVHGSHCSCYGLEDQWSEEETFPEAIFHHMNKGYWEGIDVQYVSEVLIAL